MEVIVVTVILTIAVLLSAALCIHAKYYGPQIRIYIFKPLASLLILVIAFYVGYGNTSLYKFFIASGLFLCILGDVFLMFPDKFFMHGVLSFMTSHVLFIFAFISSTNLSILWWPEAIFLAVAIFTIKLFYPHLKNNLKLPITIYIAVIVTMGCLGWERFFTLKNILSLFTAIGTMLFVISDLVLALNKFKKKFKSAELLILSTYYLAIWFIALSVSSKLTIF